MCTQKIAFTPCETKTKKTRFIEFKRDPRTGQRVFKVPSTPKKKYRPRKKKLVTEKALPDNDAANSEDYFSYDESDSNIYTQNSGGTQLKICVDLLQQMVNNGPKKKYKRKTWFQRSQSTLAEWEKLQSMIWEVMLSREVLDDCCHVCREREPVIKCNDCHENSLCYLCDDIVHSTLPLHDRCLFSEDYAKKLLPWESANEHHEIELSKKTLKLKCMSCTCCGGKNLSKRITDEVCIIVTLKGRFDLHKHHLLCEDCSTVIDPFTIGVLLKSGYWPGSVLSINYLIKEEVFILWDTFRKRMPGSSERAFLMSLNDISNDNGRTGIIDPTNFSMSFKQWNFWLHEKDRIQEKNWLECRPCEIQQHSCYVDGNSKLYRYRLGKRKRPSHYADNFFASNEIVKKYVDGIYGVNALKNLPNNSRCGGNWTAAKNTKRKWGSLDETGIEVAICRHCIAQKAINMFQVELFAHSMFLMKTFMLPRNVKFAYADVMCKLWNFTIRHETSFIDHIQPALSVMHAKGHALDCPVLMIRT